MLDRAQEGPRSESAQRSWYAGTGLGTSGCLIACTYAFDYWYGAKLIADGYISAKDFIQIFLILINTGRLIADAGSKTNDLAKGSESVGSVFIILDRYSLIDPVDPQGYKPDKITGHVELCDVDFAYPARPDVMIFKNF